MTLQPASAAYIARGFVDWLAERTGKPADQLRVSVSRWRMSSHGSCRILPRYDIRPDHCCCRPSLCRAVYASFQSLLQLAVSCTYHCHQVGRDPRLSGPALAAALAAGLASKGVAVTDFGPATTPAMFMSCILGGGSRFVKLATFDHGCSQETAMLWSHISVGNTVPP